MSETKTQILRLAKRFPDKLIRTIKKGNHRKITSITQLLHKDCYKSVVLMVGIGKSYMKKVKSYACMVDLVLQ